MTDSAKVQRPFRVAVGEPLDAKYLNLDGTPYIDTAQVLTQIPVDERHVGLTVNVFGTEYWFTDLNTLASKNAMPSSSFIDIIPSETQAHLEGRIWYNSLEKSFVMYNDIDSVALNVGEELWARLSNDNAYELLNGKAVYVKGAAGGELTVDLLDVTKFDQSIRAIGLITNSIAAGESGYVTRYGAVRDLNTSSFEVGQVIFGDPGNPGELTNVRPMSPFYPVRIGVVIEKSATVGILGVDTQSFNGTDTSNAVDGMLNGIAPFKQTISFEVAGGVIYADVANSDFPTRQFPVLYGNKMYFLDTLTGGGVGGAARVALAEGTAAVPKKNWIYVLNTSGVLSLASSIAKPTDSNTVILATCSVYDAATTLVEGEPLSYRRYNNAMFSVNNDGLLHEITRRMRVDGARWERDVNPTISIGDPDGVKLGAGLAWQLHLQNFGATDGTKYYVANHPDGVVEFDDFNDIFITSDGTEISNNRNAGYEICGAVNSEGVVDKCVVILPSGSYNANQVTQCISDYNNFAITSIGSNTGLADISFRVCRLVLKRDGTGAGGVWENPLIAATGEEFQDRRGSLLGTASGGGGGGSTVVTNFDDLDFYWYNDEDNTKIVRVDLSGLPTATERTLSIPNLDGEIVLDTSEDYVSFPKLAQDLKDKLETATPTIDMSENGYNSYIFTGAGAVTVNDINRQVGKSGVFRLPNADSYSFTNLDDWEEQEGSHTFDKTLSTFIYKVLDSDLIIYSITNKKVVT